MSANKRFERELENLIGYGAALLWIWLFGWMWALIGLGLLVFIAALVGAYAYGLHRAPVSSGGSTETEEG